MKRNKRLQIKARCLRGCAILLAATLVAWSGLAASAGQLIVCCSVDNDLFRVASMNGMRLKRVNTPQAAVERAGEGDGVLLLADGYPVKTTEIDDAVFELASRKHLRLYVEFPARVPGLDFGPAAYLKTGEFHAIVERTVVTSDAFGPDLPKDRILMIQDCHYLPAKTANPFLVLARVEGYDRLAYGLPAVTHPILFELPNGGVLVATTKLSQFVTGRYAPTEAWGPVWRMILGWLQPGKTVPALKWTPTVRPSFAKSEPLPKDALKQAVRRGTRWYLKSRLFIHPDWPEATKSGHDPLPAGASVGDGSYGFAEGFISKRTFYTGNQAVSRTLRADCNLEAAMGLACGAKLFHDQDCRLRAQRLDDLICFHSPITQGPRAKPDSPSYGLLGASDESNGSSGIYWGDDNARGILSCIAASALLETNRWDDQIVKTILSNFRTTGPYGFRPATLFEDSLHNQGWRYYWDLKNKFCCAHMESWPWATFLWLYGQTHFKPLLQRAEKGIRMMMAAYPHWQLEANRYEQERARMLLPLAWLVRADDTPEHRAWLSAIAEYIISIQDASGAVPQRLGEIVRSNDGYGANECGIIHQDGDPATDLLYSMNFAFAGMVEAAAATGEPRYAKSAERMTDFLIRCQTRSDLRPELDGTWYRGFDFAKWDYWASDGDAGWGVWTTESGWTHSWITATLALREMKTNLWSLTMNSDVRKPFAKFRPQMLPDDALAERDKVNLSGN